jgi:hypothetical protein
VKSIGGQDSLRAVAPIDDDDDDDDKDLFLPSCYFIIYKLFAHNDILKFVS